MSFQYVIFILCHGLISCQYIIWNRCVTTYWFYIIISFPYLTLNLCHVDFPGSSSKVKQKEVLVCYLIAYWRIVNCTQRWQARVIKTAEANIHNQRLHSCAFANSRQKPIVLLKQITSVAKWHTIRSAFQKDQIHCVLLISRLVLDMTGQSAFNEHLYPPQVN